MKVILLVLSAVLYASAQNSREQGVTSTGVSPNCTCGWANKNDQRIVNGRSTKQYEYPMLAGIIAKRQKMLFCGGTIISQKHVITAAHCTVDWNAAEMGIHVGHNSYDRVKYISNLYDVASLNEHPQYNAAKLVYDLAIIVIKGEFAFSRNVGPACLPTGRQRLDGQKVKVLGWGRMFFQGPASPDLLQVTLDVRTHEFCHPYNPQMEKNDRHQICTYTPNQDSCQGDSGGPLLWLNPRTNRYTLVAATSYGTDCAVYPAVNSEIGYFLPWIQQTIAKTSSGIKTCGI